MPKAQETFSVKKTCSLSVFLKFFAHLQLFVFFALSPELPGQFQPSVAKGIIEQCVSILLK